MTLTRMLRWAPQSCLMATGHTTGHELQQPSNTRQHKTIPLTRDSALPGQTVTLHCVAQTTNSLLNLAIYLLCPLSTMRPYQLCLPKRTNAPCYSPYCRCLGRCEGPDLAMGHGDPRLLSPPCHAAPLLPRCHQRSFQPANNSF